MCLSAVYKQNGDQQVFLCKNIARVVPEENAVVCFDLLGQKTVVPGRIVDVDLMENTIRIKDFDL